MEEKIKIGENLLKKNQTTYAIEIAVQLINANLKTALEKIGFELTGETLKSCFSGGMPIYDKFHKTVSEDMEKIASHSTRQMLEENSQHSWETFNHVRSSVMSKISSDIRSFITIEDGFAVFSQTSKEQLEDDCNIYITEAEEINRYELHQRACEALNAFFQGHYSAFWYQIFDFKNGQFIPEVIDYQYLNMKIKQVKNQ
jgi:hypothetical protein